MFLPFLREGGGGGYSLAGPLAMGTLYVLPIEAVIFAQKGVHVQGIL